MKEINFQSPNPFHEGQNIWFSWCQVYDQGAYFWNRLQVHSTRYNTPAKFGTALHTHPRGSETFYIVEGDYIFVLDGKPIRDKPGDTICVPKETPHRFEVGPKGGHAIVISPPELEFYFFQYQWTIEYQRSIIRWGVLHRDKIWTGFSWWHQTLEIIPSSYLLHIHVNKFELLKIVDVIEGVIQKFLCYRI